MKFIKITSYKYSNLGYKKQSEIVLNIDHIIWYDCNHSMVELVLTRDTIYITHTDLSRIENMFHSAF